MKDGVVRDVGSCRDLCAMTVVSAVRLHLEQLTNANYRSLPRGGGGLGKANATFAFKNRHNLDVVPKPNIID